MAGIPAILRLNGAKKPMTNPPRDRGSAVANASAQNAKWSKIYGLSWKIAAFACLVSSILPATGLAIDEATQPRGAAADAFRQVVGIYHWGGLHSTGLTSGVRDITALNGHIARLSVSPRMDIDYNRGPACIPGFTLAGALDDTDTRSALGDPKLDVVMLTVYDGTTFGDCTGNLFLSPEFYSQANTAVLVNEYSDFVYRLHVLFQGSGKRFILSNWEGDNAVYCNSAYLYTISQEFREQCLDAYPSSYGGNPGPNDSIEGMVLWMKARYLGAVLGRERARIEGISDVDVVVAPEISSVHMLHDVGLESVLYDVIFRVPFDYISYSSWESLNDADPASRLPSDLDLIRSVTGTDRIIVGEMGFSRSEFPERQTVLTREVTEAAIAWGAPYIVQWNLYDQSAVNDFGLFDLNGDITQLGIYYKRVFARSILTGRPPPR